MRYPIFVISAVIAIASPVMAHHSATMFNHDKILPLAGTVKNWQWINPHSWLELATSDGKGGEIDQGFEVGSPNTLFRNGWRYHSFKPGDHVKITFMPRLDGKPGDMLYTAEPQGSTQYLSWLPKGTK